MSEAPRQETTIPPTEASTKQERPVPQAVEQVLTKSGRLWELYRNISSDKQEVAHPEEPDSVTAQLKVLLAVAQENSTLDITDKEIQQILNAIVQDIQLMQGEHSIEKHTQLEEEVIEIGRSPTFPLDDPRREYFINGVSYYGEIFHKSDYRRDIQRDMSLAPTYFIEKGDHTQIANLKAALCPPDAQEITTTDKAVTVTMIATKIPGLFLYITEGPDRTYSVRPAYKEKIVPTNEQENQQIQQGIQYDTNHIHTLPQRLIDGDQLTEILLHQDQQTIDYLQTRAQAVYTLAAKAKAQDIAQTLSLNTEQQQQIQAGLEEIYKNGPVTQFIENLISQQETLSLDYVLISKLVHTLPYIDAMMERHIEEIMINSGISRESAIQQAFNEKVQPYNNKLSGPEDFASESIRDHILSGTSLARNVSLDRLTQILRVLNISTDQISQNQDSFIQTSYDGVYVHITQRNNGEYTAVIRLGPNAITDTTRNLSDLNALATARATVNAA